MGAYLCLGGFFFLFFSGGITGQILFDGCRSLAPTWSKFPNFMESMLLQIEVHGFSWCICKQIPKASPMSLLLLTIVDGFFVCSLHTTTE